MSQTYHVWMDAEGTDEDVNTAMREALGFVGERFSWYHFVVKRYVDIQSFRLHWDVDAHGGKPHRATGLRN